MAELIVNADDFGLHSDIDKGIVMAVNDGIVNSISMVERYLNSNLLNQLLKKQVLVGAHIMLVELTWLTMPYYFRNWQTFIRSVILTGKPTSDEIEAEVRRQIEELLKRNVRLSHIDSHQHVHALPKVWNVFIKVGEEYSIPRIRWSHAPSFKMSRRSFGGVGLQTMTGLAQETSMRRIPCLGIARGGRNNFEAIERELNMAGSLQDLELILHPGYTTPDLVKQYGHWGFNWEIELAAAQDQMVRNCIRKSGFEISNK